MGPFGCSDPTLRVPAFHFGGFLDDKTEVFGLESPCESDQCLSYFLPGGLAMVNTSWSYLSRGIDGLGKNPNIGLDTTSTAQRESLEVLVGYVTALFPNGNVSIDPALIELLWNAFDDDEASSTVYDIVKFLPR